MESMAVKAEPRAETGTRASGKLRAAGRMPGIIYGHGEPPDSISLHAHDVEVALAHGVRVLEVDLRGASQQYLIKDVQYDHLDAAPIHIDLTRVDLDERVTVRIGIELKGVPKGVSEGGVLDQLMADIEVDCLVTEIPDTLHPVVTHLGVGESLLVQDLELPPGVTAHADADAGVAMVRALAVAEEPEMPEEVPEETEEPERIGRVRKEEGESES
ncbi:MAG: 50S ribosomal protein L25 [Phycisphaerales bacterium]|nr:MAG: 50S ribosomal protein L25 [Phycisphaerales bacterium]